MFGLGICKDCRSIYIKKNGEGGRCYLCNLLFLSMEHSREVILEESKPFEASINLIVDGKEEIEEIEEIKPLTQPEVNSKMKIHDMLREKRKEKEKEKVRRRKRDREEKNKKYLNGY